MSRAKPEPGRIVSFYSFKGGVGRTMALANVAFLAAMNDMRVLVMDWDLEAPGLYHYFRGLVDAERMSELRAAPGILDLAWSWRNGIDKAGDAEEINGQFEAFRRGLPFETLVHTIMQESGIDAAGRLDIIPAGGDMVATPEPVEYERALAAMSWNELLDRYAGGGLIDALRGWATSNYDLILVDSRTGLADVAGICTLQLPDAVVLSFVLNRQNIEGVARVASAIRRNRSDEIKIWTVPMRVSREGTDEEADATARALRELTRPGRLEREATERDLASLVIKAEPNVPFMESLSAFNETNAALDPLTANFARLASEICSRPITIPEITEQWRDLVSSRLAPALSTGSYLRQLLLSEPNRAGRQLHGYVESALSTLADDDDLPDDYVVALAETVIAFYQRAEPHMLDELYDTSYRIVVLLRKMHERAPELWRPMLIRALEATLTADLIWLSGEDEAGILDEIDELLAAERQDIETIERRVAMRLRAARLFESAEDHEQQLAAVEEALALIKHASKLPGARASDLQTSRLEALLQRAEAQQQLDQPEEAVDTLRKIVRAAEKLDPAEISDGPRFISEASYRMMRLLRASDPAEAAQLAVIAARNALPNSPTFVTRIAEYAEVVLAVHPAGPLPADLLQRSVAPPAQPRAYAQFFNRAPASATRFISALGQLLEASRHVSDPQEFDSLIGSAVETVREVLLASAERAVQMAARPARPASGLRSRPNILPMLTQAVQEFVVSTRLLTSRPELLEAIGFVEVISADLQRQFLNIAAAPHARAPLPRKEKRDGGD